MIWHFHGKLTSKQAWPIESAAYYSCVERWSASGVFQGSLQALIDDARKSIEFVKFGQAIDHLKNLGEKGGSLLNACDNATEIAFAHYWHEPSEAGDSFFAVTIGLSDEKFSGIKTDLDNVLLHSCSIGVTVSGGFSVSESNPYSQQPTQDLFETGHPMQLQDLKLSIRSPENVA